MNFPDKWRDTVNPFELPYNSFILKEVLGYPHAGNDVFYVRGVHSGKEVLAFIKVKRQRGADIENEVKTIQHINWANIPQIIDYDKDYTFRVAIALDGERLSTILGENKNLESLQYMGEYGSTLAMLHQTQGNFLPVKDRNYFHIPPEEAFEESGLKKLHKYLLQQKPTHENKCFVHGDFHYANILWQNGHISGILDFELSGIGNKEFDIAWAIIRRPGQTFLKEPAEIDTFLKGYRQYGEYDEELLKYYMGLIYSRFYFIGDDEYKQYIVEWEQENIL